MDEHERRTGENLKFDHVVRESVQLTKGINYLLVISAEEIGAAVKKYEVIVWDKPWEGLRNLTSFPSKGE
ncbi:hypothetical protein QJS04_geneDACA006052 [Acorus gramineus]|uniref:Cystatin domain-containing protein n=1 Tax=Acorus gramineus TaxID=55184 RepID=A0AAV9B5T3_ACOGR|nr:hypothetical protein QJS04_geneDACA006052 [Acorus gramineus]